MIFKNVLIVIPCYNEEVSLPLVLQELQSIQLPVKYKLQILIINDCSQDKTSDVVRSFNAKILNLPINLGIGGAMQTGFKYAIQNGFDIAIQLDGDGQHPPSELIKLLNEYEIVSADVVIGSRFLKNEGYQSLLLRRIGIKYFYLLNKFFTGNSIYDSTSGFRLLNKKALAIAAVNYPDDYPEPDSLIIFSKAGLIIKEVSVAMRPRLGGISSIHHGASFYYCIKVTISMLFSFIRKPN
jgi:glycosyltransferase involved in cell wall biosynthesis